MRILFLGDIVGRSGREAFARELPGLRKALAPDLVIVNGENAAGGFGITEPVYQELIDTGAEVITTGNHVWDKREALVFIERVDRLLRPANFPAGAPGRGAGIFETATGKRVLVANIMGRIFMDAMDDPFAVIDRELEACKLGRDVDAVIVDFHAEATSEKTALGHFIDGRASLMVGTHTHVPTSDHRVLAGGTAYVSDIGMCGDYDSVIGMEKDEPLNRFLNKIPSGRFAAAGGEATVTGVICETDDKTGLATRIAPVRMGGLLEPTLPEF